MLVRMFALAPFWQELVYTVVRVISFSNVMVSTFSPSSCDSHTLWSERDWTYKAPITHINAPNADLTNDVETFSQVADSLALHRVT